MQVKSKEKPILFSAPMVRAILDGRKTQTRRIMKPSPTGIWGQGIPEGSEFFFVHANIRGEHRWLPCPFGKPGDRLWVRETFVTGHDYIAGELITSDEDGNDLPEKVWYRATDGEFRWFEDDVEMEPKWRPSIHMPRWASRITLEITSVRVERLQDISESDAQAEGVYRHPIAGWLPCAQEGHVHLYADTAFRHIWQSAYGEDSWVLNPWVWVIEFRRLQ